MKARIASVVFCFAAVAQQTTANERGLTFSIMATERLSDVAFLQPKLESRGKQNLAAADFDLVPMRVTSQGRSDLYNFSGSAPLRFVRGGAVLDPLDENAVASWFAPPSSGRVLILLAPWLETRDGRGLVALDDSVAGFPARHVRLINLSRETVEGAIDGDVFRLATDLTHTRPQSVGERIHLGVTQRRDGEGRRVVVFDQTLTLGESERLLVVFLAPFRPGADLRTRIVKDTVIPPVPAP